jgi:hypothetical protein
MAQVDGIDLYSIYACFGVQLVASIFLSISMIVDLKVRAWFKVRFWVRGLELGFGSELEFSV